MIASHVAATLLAIFASPSAVVGDNLVGQGVASKTGYEYSDPPAIPSCGVEYGSVPNGVALRRSIIGDGSPPAMCGVCYRLTAAPELYDEVTYQFQGNTAIGGWTQVVQVVDTAPNNNPVLSHGVELEYVFDLPNSIFDAASDVHPGAAGLPPSGHIPLMYEQIACDDAPDTTTAATDPSSTTTTTSTIITDDPDELTINRENRCGVSEVDAREHCKNTCLSSADCANGEHCWSVHANYCGSIPQRIYNAPILSNVGHRCGRTGVDPDSAEVHARTFCGEPCPFLTCNDPGYECKAVNLNYCESDYTTNNDPGTTSATTVIDTTTTTIEPDISTTTVATATSTTPPDGPIELTINRENRCGVSEVDAREHCKDTCVSNVDCADGEYCWGVHANYCGSFPKRVYSSPEQGPWFLCGQGDTEEERRIWAQTFCGFPCASDWTCSEPGQVCTTLNENWCGSDYIEV